MVMRKKINRILLTMLVGLLSIPSFAQKSDSPLRLAVAGVTHGHLWEVISRINRSDFTIVGVAEKDDRYLHNNDLTGRVSENLFYKDLGKMLDETRPEVVVAYGSIYDHLSVVEACAPRHIHVMVEKPLATTVEMAEKIEKLAKQYGILVMTNYETSWYATNHHIYNLLQDGTLGNIRRLNIYDGHEGPKEINCSERFLEWLTDPVLNGGGAVIDFGCYGANLATWYLKGEKPISVYAVLHQHKPTVYPKVDDDATIVVKYAHATVQIMGSWCWPTGRKDMHMFTSKGAAYQFNTKRMQTFLNGKQSAVFDAPALQAPYNDSFLYLKAVVRGEIKLQPYDLASLENNMMVVRILNAAIESAKTGEVVKF